MNLTPADQETPQLGRVVLFGSGETSPSGRKILDGLLRSRQPGRGASFAILETPAGFEPNSAWVAGQMAEFVNGRLAEHRPKVIVIPARRKLAEGGTDDPELLAPLWTADVIYLGAGSPSYAVRQLAGSLAWQILRARLRVGADVVLASASTLAAAACTAPIYEIYKVGEDLRWMGGLDILADFGVRLAIIPHWNNTDGGANLDTSHCYLGEERMRALLAMLPEDVVTIGIDEHTALILELASGRALVQGNGGVTVLDRSGERRIGAGDPVPLADVIGPYQEPADGAGIDSDIWRRALGEATAAVGNREGTTSNDNPPATLLALVAARESARAARDWAEADRLRGAIAATGWDVRDTAAGQELVRSGRGSHRDANPGGD